MELKAVSELEFCRDNAMTKLVVDVQNAVKKWASTCNDGALVWSIANEFKELWYDWGLALSQPKWTKPKFVLEALETIDYNIQDDAVCIAIDTLKQTIFEYAE